MWRLKPIHLAALVAVALVAVTSMLEAQGRAERAQRLAALPDVSAPAELETETADAGRTCSIYHARFGGTRARLVRIVRGDVANYVVVEVPRGNRVLPSIQSAWLRAAFGEGEPAWLGEFATPDSALIKAARLCPLTARCQPGEPDCGPDQRMHSFNVPRET